MEPIRKDSLRRSVIAYCVLALLFCLSFPLTLFALPQKLGDLDEDGQPTVVDIARLVNHLKGTTPLSTDLLPFADVNQDNTVNQADVNLLANIILGLAPFQDLPTTGIVEVSPANGENGVAVSRETIFRFNHPLAPSTLLTTNDLCACFGGRQILSRIELSTDRKKVTLFYQEPLPASARVRVTFNGTNVTDYLGRALDLDGDGQPGGNAIVDFDTLSITPVSKTAVIGHIYASVQVPVVSTNTTTNFVNQPLENVRITVSGAEEDRGDQLKIETYTDASGAFILSNCPAGRFFVNIDGRTASNSVRNGHLPWFQRAYYPLVGKPWEAVAGRTNNLGDC